MNKSIKFFIDPLHGLLRLKDLRDQAETANIYFTRLEQVHPSLTAVSKKVEEARLSVESAIEALDNALEETDAQHWE